MKLYEDFAKTQAKKKVEKDLVEGGDTMEEEEEATGDFTHIFQVTYLGTCIRAWMVIIFHSLILDIRARDLKI